jgi:hypothetical protein
MAVGSCQASHYHRMNRHFAVVESCRSAWRRHVTPRETRLFLSGLFFGGGLDHAIFMATGSPNTHYGLTVGAMGQLAFALFDFSVAALLYLSHDRWRGPAVLPPHAR